MCIYPNIHIGIIQFAHVRIAMKIYYHLINIKKFNVIMRDNYKHDRMC